MCTSIAEGGRRCKIHEAKIAKNKLKKARESGDAEAINEAKLEFFQTETGIEQLEEAGKDELAEKFRALRNRRIELHNAHWGTKHKLMEPRAVRLRRKAPLYNLRGFDQNGIHRETGTIYDARGWDVKRRHKDTHTEYAPDGFNWVGIDTEGYDRDGFKNGYDRDGFNKAGRDRDGFSREGYNRFGYDRSGYNSEGWNKEGVHKETGKRWDADGFDRYGYHHESRISKETGMTPDEEITHLFG